MESPNEQKSEELKLAERSAKFAAILQPEARRAVEEWNRGRGPEFQIRYCDVAWNFSGQRLLKYESSSVSNVPVILATAAEQGVNAGLASETLWVSLWGDVREGAENEFVTALQKLAAEKAKNRIVFGGDEFHFTAGIPLATPSDQRLILACKDAGFAGTEESDLAGSLSAPEVDGYIDGVLRSGNLHQYTLNRVQTRAGLSDFDAFMSREFPGRWTREFRFWRDNSDGRRAFWMTLTKTADGGASLENQEIIGCARMVVRDRMEPLDAGWTPGALRLPTIYSQDQAAAWKASDSCLGPIGIAASERGKGLGKIILALAIFELRNRYAESICIDWTSALKYYEPLQFANIRRYFTASKGGLK